MQTDPKKSLVPKTFIAFYIHYCNSQVMYTIEDTVLFVLNRSGNFTHKYSRYVFQKPTSQLAMQI